MTSVPSPAPFDFRDDTPRKEETMKSLLQIQRFAPEMWERFSEEDKAAFADEFKALAQTPGVTPRLLLQPPEMATTVRMEDGKAVMIDGAFVNVTEALSGYLVYEADDLDAAIELATCIPHVKRGGAVEVRPVMEG
jgi:hypothetical protein